MGITSIIRIVAVLVIVLVSAAGFWYVSGLRADLAISKENAKKLESAVDSQKQVIELIKADQEKIQKINNELTTTVKKQNQDVQDLRDRFNTSASGKQRDIGEIAVAKTKSVEKIINNATVNSLRCIEIASGSPLTEAEKNANSPDKINTECPSMANPNYKPTSSK